MNGNQVLWILVVILGFTSCNRKACVNKTVGWTYGPDEKGFESSQYMFQSYRESFEAVGHNPEWKVKLENDDMIYSDIRLSEPVTYHLMTTFDSNQVTYTGIDSLGNKIIIDFVKADCRDQFEGITRPFRVSVTRTNSESESGQNGCGVYVEDPRLNGKWWIRKMNGKKMGKTNNGNYGTLTFDSKNDRVGARISCNSMGGGYVLDKNILHFNKNTITTLMMCDKHMDLEEKLAKNISGVSLAYSFVSDDEMVLLADNKVVFELERAQ
ncbi:META domain-containing protein [bacterium SCSIO 12643]|nr:META domain-containing protein [bacterium SCSIO 12643]